MKKCIIIPDSFKGTMSSTEVCNIMKSSLLEAFPQCNVITVPIADGGEGTVDCFLHAIGGEIIQVPATGPFLTYIKSFYGVLQDTAVIEIAAAAGLPLATDKMDPSIATTFGVGELILDAVNRGCNKIILGLGGSCTNDAGAGMAAALGTKFYDSEGSTFIPNGATLHDVAKIDNTETLSLLKGIEVEAICDINNQMYGQNGAACVFAPQKGADPEMVTLLDENLRSFASAIQNSLCIDVSNLKGGGAAGAMGAGAYAFLGAKLKPGIEILLDMIHFDEMLDGCDYVFTGEGRLDCQSLDGKVIAGVVKRAKQKSVPVIAVVGSMDHSADEIYDLGISQISAIHSSPVPPERLRDRAQCRLDLLATMKQAIRKISVLE